MCKTDFSNLCASVKIGCSCLVLIHVVISEEINFIFRLNVASPSTLQFMSVKSSNTITIQMLGF